MMKLNPLGDLVPKDTADIQARTNAAVSGTKSSDNASAAAPVDATVPTEKIEFSAASQAMQQLAGEPFDAAKVQQIRKAISEGKFNIHAEKVADRMISESAELMVRIFGVDPTRMS